jgi:putative ABC transport system permease protein
MIKNIVTITLRLFRRRKGFTLINLAGLAVSLAACLLISVYIREELSFDRFHTRKDRIYRLGGATVGWPYGRILQNDYPEVESTVYLRTYPTYAIKWGEQRLYERMLYASRSFFDLFDFPLLEGTSQDALKAPYSVVLSEGLAAKLFRDENALGQTLVFEDLMPCMVTGVVRVPRHSHIQFDALLSFETLRAVDPNNFDREMSSGWLDLNVTTYVLLRPGTNAEAFAAKIRDLPQKYAGSYLKQWGSEYPLRLEPLARIYLRSESGNWLGPKSDIDYVYLLFIVGLFLLVIAGANFVNLATALSLGRAREVGVRKVVGSSRRLLVRQFLGESFVTCLLASILACGLAALSLPLFNSLAARSYEPGDVFSPVTGLVTAGLALVVALLAGLYPACFLASFRPVEVLHGRFSYSGRGIALRRSLVVAQFIISSILIAGALVVVSQIRYMRAKDLGFDAGHVLVLDVRRVKGEILSRQMRTFLDELRSHPGVEIASSMGAVPGRTGWRGQISFPEGWPEDTSLSLEYVPVGYNFERTLGLKIIAGRTFDPAHPLDARTAVVINEAALREAGWVSPQEALGKGFASPGSGKPDGNVIGVIEDYHHHGLQEKIKAMMFGYREANGYVALRIRGAEADSVLRHVRKVWNQIFQGYPLTSFFLAEDFDQQYGQEYRLMNIFGVFSLLTILIACLGLFALAAYSVSQRVKEIGVRKVFGASTSSIVRLLSLDFLKLVFVAVLAAAPAGYILMNRWLQNFAYRTTIKPGLFLLDGAALLLLALIAVSSQVIKTSLVDPAESLRHE